MKKKLLTTICGLALTSCLWANRPSNDWKVFTIDGSVEYVTAPTIDEALLEAREKVGQDAVIVSLSRISYVNAIWIYAAKQ